MTYAEFKKSDIYKTADIVEIFDENGTEVNDNISEDELNEMEVVSVYGSGLVSVILKG